MKECTDGFDTTNTLYDRIDASIRALLGNDIEQYAREQASEIARQAGDYTLVKRLTSNELYAMHCNADTSGVSDDDLKRFRRGDIIMRVKDDDGETYFIAVEASYIADDRDTTRAARNAEFLTRFTGCPAVAVIASVHLDRRIEWIVESAEFFWYEMEKPR